MSVGVSVGMGVAVAMEVSVTAGVNVAVGAVDLQDVNSTVERINDKKIRMDIAFCTYGERRVW
jgi:hypothetical protein